MPSRTANSIHVINQCIGFCQAGYEVTLYSIRHKKSTKESDIKKYYGVKNKKLTISSLYTFISIGLNIINTLYFLGNIKKIKNNDLIISRNLYASFVINIFLRKKSIYETHQLELGFKGFLQKLILNSSISKTVVISKSLKEILESKNRIKIKNCYVLHDAAPKGNKIKSINLKRKTLQKITSLKLDNYLFICGYFGHLYKGRGIEIINSLANHFPKYLFLIFGGNQKDIEERRRSNKHDNLIYMGYVKNHEARRLMCCMDSLLMPYQNKVSIGKRNSDTSRWMSPMKMFEYLSSGVPIFSSNLPVLREILINNFNSILVSPEDENEWIEKLTLLETNKSLLKKISKNAFSEYKKFHTWEKRALSIINIAKN
tara:strand:+ start:14928 stop:16043 length:1116 start_codon:yes stop_codon:yes gene_type:complete